MSRGVGYFGRAGRALVHPVRNSLLLLAFVVGGTGLASAQTFTVTPASGPGPFTITLQAPTGATNCQAAGIADWSGPVAATVTKSVKPAVGAKTLTVACTVPGPVQKASVTLSWIAPTQNTDNTPLTNLAGFRIYYGPTATNLSQTVNLLSLPGLTRYEVLGLDAGTWHFAMTALNSAGIESDKTGTVSKALTDVPTTQPWTASASIDVTAPVPAKPKPPVLSIEQAPPS